jgi:hypothetical protein
VQKYGYLAMLAFTLCGSIWLEVVLKVGVVRRFKRVILSILVAIGSLMRNKY